MENQISSNDLSLLLQDILLLIQKEQIGNETRIIPY